MTITNLQGELSEQHVGDKDGDHPESPDVTRLYRNKRDSNHEVRETATPLHRLNGLSATKVDMFGDYEIGSICRSREYWDQKAKEYAEKQG